MKAYLLYVHYEYYCQGVDTCWQYFLVHANSAQEAGDKLSLKAKEFGILKILEIQNHTVL